ncbi:MAG: sulfatase-like hydrolase/transferase [bacterium]|nr:sulfatase-like hydrolase/transferase [bacterium]
MKRFLYTLVPLLLITIISCALLRQEEPGSIFLITLDATRADYIDYSTANNSLTPNFAALAAKGSYFENAYSLIPITLPSHATMFHSLLPHQLKSLNNGRENKVKYPSLAKLLKKRGFRTGAVVSLGALKKDFGLHTGFDEYIDSFKTKKAGDVNRDAFDLIKRTIEKKEKTEKSFFWIHYSDPHEPYFPPCNDGNFNLSFENKKLFTCRSTEYATINTEITLQPGKNTLTLDSGIPSAIKEFKDAKISYFKYRNFVIEPLATTAPTETGTQAKSHPKSKADSGNAPAAVPMNAPEAPLEIIPPDYWTSKKDKQNISYYSNKPGSQLTVVNKTGKAIIANLRFFYSMHVDDKTRKLFYKEEIRYMDKEFGHLMEFLKKNRLYDNSTFIVMGDHAEGLGEYRGHYGHTHYLNKVFSRVPLIIAGTGVKKQGKRDELVSNLNIAPTILDLAHIKKPHFMLGQSMLKPIAPKKLLLETFSPESYFDAFSLIDYPWQIVFYPGRREGKLEFFDLSNDPYGTINLNDLNNLTESAKTAEVKKIKSELINSILNISRIVTATKGKAGRFSKRHREILKSLGYL